MSDTMIWAHRGASAYAPENTLEAFQLALEMGADGIELDVHLTKDNIPVVAHDKNIDRCSNGKGNLADYTLEQLKTFDFSNHKAGYVHVKIPTMEEVLHLVACKPVCINVEIKRGERPYAGIEQACLTLAKRAGVSNRVIYSSFYHHTLCTIKNLDPAAQTAPLYMAGLVRPWKYARSIGASAIHPHFETLSAGQISDCKAHRILINTWTVDRPESIRFLKEAGVHAIITNVPDLAKSIK